MMSRPHLVQQALPSLQITTLQSLPRHRASFVLEPLARGIAATMGDTLKRVLLPHPVDVPTSPVRRLDVVVEPARGGAGSAVERLRIEIETDGSVSPVEALSRGARALIGAMNWAPLPPGAGLPAPRPPTPEDALLQRPIDDLGLSVRCANGLRALGIERIGDLVRLTADELLRAPYLGRRPLTEIEDALRFRGLRLRDGFQRRPPAAAGWPH